MPFTIVDILYSGLLPAVVALAVWFLARRVLNEDAAARYAPALSLAIGYSVGYWLLWSKDHDYWMPKFAYDWLAVVVALSAIWGPIVHARGVSWFERLLGYLLFGVIVTWFLVPDRPKLEPMRLTYILSFGSSLALIAFLLDGVCERFRGPLLPGLLAFALMCLAAILQLGISTSYALSVGAAVAALGGITVATLWTRDATPKGLSLTCITLLFGGVFIRQFYVISDSRLESYIILPLAPLLMWCAVRGPLSKGSGFIGGVKKIALPVIACLVAVGMVAVASFGAAAE